MGVRLDVELDRPADLMVVSFAFTLVSRFLLKRACHNRAAETKNPSSVTPNVLHNKYNHKTRYARNHAYFVLPNVLDEHAPEKADFRFGRA